MEEIPDGSVDMILCDLPYGTTGCKWDAVIPFDVLWKHYKRVVKPNGAVVLFAAQPFTTALIHSNMRQYRYNWYWKKKNKTGGAFAKIQPMRCVEDICVFYKKAPTYNPQGLKRLAKARLNRPVNGAVYGCRARESKQEYTGYPNHLLEFTNETIVGKTRLHPTQKPVALLEYLVKTYTNPGETVLDNCMGSGSTGVACVNTGRNFIGIEKDISYFDIASERINTAWAG